MKNGETVKIYCSDNKWHEACYIGQTKCGSHVVEIGGRIHEGALVEPIVDFGEIKPGNKREAM